MNKQFHVDFSFRDSLYYYSFFKNMIKVRVSEQSILILRLYDF